MTFYMENKKLCYGVKKQDEYEDLININEN